MNKQDDDIIIILAARYYIYDLLQHIFGNEPSLKLLEIVTSGHTVQSLQILESGNSKSPDILTLLNQLRDAISSDPEYTLENLKTEYTALLIGPLQLPAPPWESVYRSKERLIFQESTLVVRRAYLKYQFLPANYPHEADDHLALELDFMANLAKLTLDRFEKNCTDEAVKLLNDQRLFLENHLLFWIDKFAHLIQDSKTHHFYPQIALFTACFLKQDLTVINDLSSVLHNKENTTLSLLRKG